MHLNSRFPTRISNNQPHDTSSVIPFVPHMPDTLAARLSIVSTAIASFGTFAGNVSLIASRLNVVGHRTSL
ncbi:MAG: hypothetical protein WA364_10790 [Candidatus Nitrosopolaris sp.]